MKVVMYISFTNHSGLSSKLREADHTMGELTGYKLKIVERAGTKLEDLLTKSNPWQGIDCGRTSCLLCESKERTGLHKTQDCHKRSCVYEIWCQDCLALEWGQPADGAGGQEVEVVVDVPEVTPISSI